MNKKIIIITIIFILFDQISKFLITNYMNLNEVIKIIPNFLSLNYVRNEGAAFSILNGHRLLFILIGILGIYIIYKYFIKDSILDNYSISIYSMLIGGIIGNIIDRVLYGYVIDFISFKIFNYDFAIFNFADSFIVISILLILLDWRKNGKDNS